MPRFPLVPLAVVAGFTHLAFGCSSDASLAAPVPDAGFDAVSDVSEAQAVPTEGGDPDPEPPAGLPGGWEIERTYSKHCGLYVPSSEATLPAPIRWEACPSSVTPAGSNCRLMAIDGEPAKTSTPAGAEGAWVRDDGSVVLAAYRSAKPDWYYSFVADADGPVHSALLETDSHRCLVSNANVFASRYTLQVYEYGSATLGGFIAGDVSPSTFRPRIAVHTPPPSSQTPYAGPFAILDLTEGYKFQEYSWETGAPLGTMWSAAQDNGLQQGVPVFAKTGVFWPSSDLHYQKVKVYSPAVGVRDFLVPSAVDRGIGELGTDSKDLVWIEAQGHTGDSAFYDMLTIRTAPFTTDPDAVSARRVRSEEGPGFGASHFIVGCGFAARSTGAHIRLVRLSDGQSWKLANAFTTPWAWTEPLAVTCDELFAMVSVAGVSRLARVRLDSLGPGIVAD